MKVRIVAVDVETCSIYSKYPTYSDFIISISVHTSKSIDPSSTFQEKQFVVKELTYDEEKRIIADFLNFLNEKTGSILTAYNLIGFDQQVLFSRSKEHYPLGFRFLDILPGFSLYDTMVAFKAHVGSPVSCTMIQAIQELSKAGYDCFIIDQKSKYSGKDILSLWAKDNAGVSNDFTSYISEDSYNHLRLAQVLLSLNAKQGYWSAPSVIV